MCGRISQFFALKKCISPSSWKSWLIALLGMQIMRIEFIQCHHGKSRNTAEKIQFWCLFSNGFLLLKEKISLLIYFPFWSLFFALHIFSLLENCGEEEATDVNVAWVIFKIRLYWMESRFQNVWGCVIIVSQFCVYFNFFLRIDEMEW